MGRPAGRLAVGFQTAWESRPLRPAARRDHRPLDGATPDQAARSPPKGSASTRRTLRPVGQAIASAVAVVVTPGAPLIEATTTINWRGNAQLATWRCSRPTP